MQANQQKIFVTHATVVGFSFYPASREFQGENRVILRQEAGNPFDKSGNAIAVLSDDYEIMGYVARDECGSIAPILRGESGKVREVSAWIVKRDWQKHIGIIGIKIVHE